MEPLALLSYYEQKGLMKPSMVRLVKKRLKYVEEGVRRVEEASSLNYPKYYIEPRLHLCSDGSVTSLGVFYARMIPMEFEDRIEPMVELSAALIALGSKYTIHAVLAHEFLHYVEFAMRLKNFSITSDAPVYSNFEAVYVDEEKLVDPKKVFKSRSLLNLLKKKFQDGVKSTCTDIFGSRVYFRRDIREPLYCFSLKYQRNILGGKQFDVLPS